MKLVAWAHDHVILPGHVASLQLVVDSKGPVQLLPPWFGLGLVQVRVLVCVPVPHVLVQALNWLHKLKPPLTGNTNKQTNRTLADTYILKSNLNVYSTICFEFVASVKYF